VNAETESVELWTWTG